MSTLTLTNVSKVFSDGYHAVRNLDLHVDDGEFMVLVGPSGCGKTTALRMIAGIESISAGELRIGDIPANDLTPQQRDLAMVFQQFALYPHMTARENIEFPLRRVRVHRRLVDDQVDSVARRLQISDILERKPHQMSGGQQQRVAMARAIVRQPHAFLLDEPLSNLDARLRVRTRGEIARLHALLGITTVYVTHDQVEAMTLGTRVAVMRDGVLVQVGTPGDLYHRPCDAFVATFMGSPSMNIHRARVHAGHVQIGSQQLPLSDRHRTASPGLADRQGGDVLVGIRPEHLSHTSHPPHDGPLGSLQAEVVGTEGIGSDTLVHFTLDTPRYEGPDIGDVPRVFGRPVSVARFEPDSALNRYAPVTLRVELDRLHFFDPSTGLAL